MRSRSRSPSTPNLTAHPSREWRGTNGARTRTHTHPNNLAGDGGAQPKPEPKHTHPRRTPKPGVAGHRRSEHKNTHTPTPQPGEARRSRNPSPRTHTRTVHPSQEWRVTGEARTQTHTHPNTPARSGGAQPKPEFRHTHPCRRPQPGVAGYMAGYKRSEHTNMHTPPPQPGGVRRSRDPSPSTKTHTAQPSQEWRATSGAHTQAHTHPDTPARSGRAEPKPEPKHTRPHHTPQPGEAGYKQSAHTHTPAAQPGVAGRSRNQTPSTHTHAAQPSQEWRGTS